MKRVKRPLLILLSLVLFLSPILSGCALVTVVPGPDAETESGSASASDRAEIVSAEGFEKDGNTLSVTVPNATDSLSLANRITVSKGATWQISSDREGRLTIQTKTLLLEAGDNLFYILVIAEDGKAIAPYTLSIRRRPLYTVTFDTNGDYAAADVRVEEGDALAALVENPTRRGYTFSGWDSDLSQPVTSDLTVTAQWTINTYPITYDLDGGTNAESNPAAYTVKDEITLADPTRDDYVFLGWSGNGTIPAGSTGPKTFTASWMPDNSVSYVIEYYLQNAAGTGYDLHLTEKKGDQSGALVTAEQKTFDHFTFRPGESTATGTVAEQDDALVLKMYYTRNSYTVTFDGNGGTLQSGNASQTVRYGNSIQPPPVFTRDGYDFSSWNGIGECDAVEKDLTLVANWTPKPFEPEFDAEYEQVITGKMNEMNNETPGAYYLVEAPSRAGVAYPTPLPAPASLDTAATRTELIEIANYYAFYRAGGFSVTLLYPASDAETELNYLYRNSGYLPSLCAVFGSLENGTLTVNLKFYPESYLGGPRHTTPAKYIGVENAAPTGPETFPGLDPEHGVSVWDSEQAAYALAHGYSISPIPGSPAETIVNYAQSVLSEMIDDSMTEWQIAYRVYRWLMEHAAYDRVLEEWAGGVSTDVTYESEMYSARLISFKAEGPLLYGIGACFGFAKASALLLGLEGINVRRVVAFDRRLSPGRSCIRDGTKIAVHSYLYLRIDGLDYIFDPTAVNDLPMSVWDSTAEEYVNISILGDFCIGLSFTEHRTIFDNYPDDPFSASDEYRPGMYNYLTELTYDGTHDLLFSSTEEAQNYYDYLLATVFSGEPEFRTVAFFYDGMNYNFWSSRYKSQLIAFLEETGVPYSYKGFGFSSNRTVSDVIVMIVFGK